MLYKLKLFITASLLSYKIQLLTPIQHFELLPESTLQSAQSSLLASLTPEVTSLLSRVETHLDKLARREQALIAKCELQEGRLSSSRSSGGIAKAGRTRGRGDSEADRQGSREESVDRVGLEQGREALRLKQMRQKKERLSYAVERLTVQAQQRERQLRMSMAAQ